MFIVTTSEERGTTIKSGVASDKADVFVIEKKSTEDWFLQCAEKILALSQSVFDTRRLRVVVDVVDIAKLNPLVKRDSWHAGVAMLLLAFPDVDWSFLSPITDESTNEIVRLDTLSYNASMKSIGADLFDPRAIRNSIRRNIGRSATTEADKPLIRQPLAFVLEDEDEYAFFHAYALYRLGYRCYCPTRLEEAKTVLEESSFFEPPVRSLEDLYISFPDQEVGIVHLSDFSERDDCLPRLESCQSRVLISVAHDLHQKGKGNNGNTQDSPYRKACDDLKTWKEKNQDRSCDFIKKPTNGLFDLMEQIERCIPQQLKNAQEVIEDTTGSGFSAEDNWTRHSAPGRLKLVADTLMRRAKYLATSGARVPQIVTAAVFASDALELAQQTPTVAVEALILMHEMEVKAECEFSGVTYAINLEPRFDDLKTEVEKISRYVNEERREAYELNMQAIVLTHILRVYRDYGKFDEEQQCLVRLRELNCELYFWKSLDRPVGKLCGAFCLRVMLIPLAYFNWLLESIWCFVFFIAYWLFVLTSVFQIVGLPDEINSFWLAVETFFGPNVVNDKPEDLTYLIRSVVWFAKLLGIIHIGAFMSHLYTLIRRR